MPNNRIFDDLEHRAKHALNSHSRDLAYEAYGAAKMAYTLNAITWDQFKQLNVMLVVNGLNDPARCHLD